MNTMRNRIVIVVVVLVAIAGLMSCSPGSLISRTQPTATPTKTPKPTFTATATPTDTPIPTDTPTPTSTATPTPEATNTPIILTATPTDTPVATDTLEPTVPPTNTPRPTTRPTNRPPATATPRPQPTNTPAPAYQFAGAVVWDPGVAPNCSGPAVSNRSIIKDKSGNPVNGVVVTLDCYGNVWNSHPSGTPGEYDAGHYDFSLSAFSPQAWTCTIWVASINGQPAASSEKLTIQFDTNPCEPGGSGHQVAIVNWTKNW